jgi:DNA invertase Pin-like site-specific DNA recombinase
MRSETTLRRSLRRFVMGKKLVAYYRVSTAKQERSGLGLEAQRSDVEDFARREGCEIIAAYVEAESAWKDTLQNRPELQKAIAHAKAANATLVIAKLDRLARSVYVTQLLKRTGVRFTCCDMPNANSLTIDVIAAVNEDESRRISARTRAAMEAAKRQGRRFGTPQNLKPEAARIGRLRGAEAARKRASEAYEHVLPLVAELRCTGKSHAQIAAELNARGYVTRRQRPWNPVQVARVLARSGGLVAA